MKFAKLFVLVALAAAFTASTSGCGYNTMQAKEEQVSAQWANVESAYQRRNDLIPSLVETVKGYASHEKDTFVQVAQARASVGSMRVDPSALKNAEKMQQFQAAQQTLGTALSRLMVVAERYPELKASEHFMNLQAELAGTENRIHTERVRYNKAVMEFNTYIRQFPYSVTNSVMLHLERKVPFKADDGAKVAPKVSFKDKPDA